MQSWTIFASFIAGIYFLFLCLAIKIWLDTKYRIALFQILLSTLNIFYIFTAIYFINSSFMENTLFNSNFILFMSGSFSVCTYFYAISYFFQWKSKLSKWLPRILAFFAIFGTILHLLPLITGDLYSSYKIANKVHANPFIHALYGKYEPGLPIIFAVVSSGIVSLFGHIYYFFKILKTDRSEVLFLMGIVLTVLSVLNDNLLGVLQVTWLFPLSMIGFVLESYRFNLHIFETQRRETESLRIKVNELAIFSQAGRIAQQMSHDVRSMVRKLYQNNVSNNNLNENSSSEALYKDIIEVLNFYNNKIKDKKRSRSESSTCELKKIIKSVIETHKNSLIENNIEINLKIPVNLQVGLSYAEGIVVFDNLFRNSIKALIPLDVTEKSIQIETHIDKNNLVISFSDSGPGIPVNDKPYLFDTRHSRAGKDLGLGLSIVREVLFERGGLIQLNEEKSFTCFELRFHKNSDFLFKEQ